MRKSKLFKKKKWDPHCLSLDNMTSRTKYTIITCWTSCWDCVVWTHPTLWFWHLVSNLVIRFTLTVFVARLISSSLPQRDLSLVLLPNPLLVLQNPCCLLPEVYWKDLASLIESIYYQTIRRKSVWNPPKNTVRNMSNRRKVDITEVDFLCNEFHTSPVSLIACNI